MQKTIEQENGTLTIIGNNHWIEIEYGIPEWEEGGELHPYVRYKGEKVYLDDFMPISSYAPEYLQGYHGILNDSFFSGLLIILGEGENDGYVKAYTFYS